MTDTTSTPQRLDLAVEAREYAGTDEYGGAELLRDLADAYEALSTERDDLDHQLAQHVIALRDMRNERDVLVAQVEELEEALDRWEDGS